MTSLRPRRTVCQLDVEALYVRLDRQRRQQRISWRAISRDTGISISTFSRIAQGHAVESDALITLMVWLGLTDITELTTTRPAEEAAK